jgi:hypothetical protein
MQRSAFGLALGLLACLVVSTAELVAQQVTVSTPYQALGDSFYENFGTSWGLSGPNWSFRSGGSPMQAAPQFGGFDPNAGANFGFARQGGPINGWFNGNWSSGYRQSFVSQVPSVTLTNGVPGFIADTSQSPFVVSFVPIVGFAPPGGFQPMQPFPPAINASPGGSGVGRDAVISALERARAEREQRERLAEQNAAQAEVARMNPPAGLNLQSQGGPDDLTLMGGAPPAAPVAEGAADEATRKLVAARASSAGRPAPSVAEARRLHAADQTDQEHDALVYEQLARNAEAKGKPNVAKVYYQMAARRASGQVRQRILTRLDALKTASEASP